MKPPVTALLFTRDEDLARAITAYAAAWVTVRRMPVDTRLTAVVEQAVPALLLLDMRSPHALEWIEHIQQAPQEHVIIAFGAPHSEPLREAQALGVYATESVALDRGRFQMLIDHAVDRVRLQQEIQLLRETSHEASAQPHAKPRAESHTGSMPLHHFSRALRRFDDPAALLDSIVEGIAGTAKVTRAGLFAQQHNAGPYRLQAGLRCLEDTPALEFDEDHPLIRWLMIHAHMVARSHLDHIGDPSDRAVLKGLLNQLGAELLIPLFARGQLSGWLFLGQRSTGVPFTQNELEDLNVVTEHVATTLENAKLYEEVALQKTLAETLFQSIPIGVAAVGADGFVRWFNDAAERLLNLPCQQVLNQPVGILGSRLADYLHRSYKGEPCADTQEWQHPDTKRYLSVQTHRLIDRNDQCLGAVALIHDLTDIRHLREKQEQLDRAAFWTELAASMSHEIRNPLVAIKTFAQLLPQRFDDPDFRAEFSKMVSAEVGRLDNIIEQINAFANPPSLAFSEVDVEAIVEKAMTQAKAMHELPSHITIERQIAPGTPPVWGDKDALKDSLAHLIVNAVEALPRKENGRIHIKAEPMPDPTGNGRNGASSPWTALEISDNGHGIPADIEAKMFSPFATTKARGMGLGLPIAKRTAVDHNGRVTVETGNRGTTVRLELPTTSSS